MRRSGEITPPVQSLVDSSMVGGRVDGATTGLTKRFNVCDSELGRHRI